MMLRPTTFADLCEDVRSTREVHVAAAALLKTAQREADYAWETHRKAQIALDAYVKRCTEGAEPAVVGTAPAA